MGAKEGSVRKKRIGLKGNNRWREGENCKRRGGGGTKKIVKSSCRRV